MQLNVCCLNQILILSRTLLNRESNCMLTHELLFNNQIFKLAAASIGTKFTIPCYLMNVLVTSKNKEEPNKNEGACVATPLNIDFSNTQRQITPRSEVGSGRNSNSSEMLRMSFLLLRIKKIRIKMKALEWPQD